MIIKAEQLSSAISSLSQSYLLTGDEPLLLMEAQDTVRAAAREQGYTERHVFDVTKQFDFNQVHSDADNLSLFAEKKITELRFDKLPDKAQQEQIKELISRLNEDTLLLVSCPKLDKRQLNSAWVKALNSQGTVVQIWPVAGYQLPQWIKQRAQASGLKLTDAAVSVLVERSEGNLLATKQDIDRLQLLCEQETVDAPQVLDTIADNARYNVFELIDSALSGEVAKTRRMIELIQAEGVVPVILVATVYREARNLLKMSYQLRQGDSMSEVLKQYRVWSNRSRLITGALNRVPFGVWERIVSRCGHLDKLAKGSEVGNVWDELLTCLLLMGGQSIWRRVL
ncbi:DNA polymerase III subunit delta [Pleionea litopenaei]|uniref:DNA polymerase III subunit delta n=1 Tax=Pleionea litopenaei TaxID=3070815 RepID=A0AA51X668_9GAMM|nr:DNA polymerase III subunit delta [Pleionea sp. HL-JVS1]WMS86559.1 DNA polymerase III subunit delta [Pleionea sp. HL-JVS1]